MLNISFKDRLIIQVDNILRRPEQLHNYPAQTKTETVHLEPEERNSSISMLRVNHSGEVCAQALYQGQALFARTNTQYMSLMQAAVEENDHLNWCHQRLNELDGRTSYLNPFWYASSFAIGAFAGMAGDGLSLGFLAETEYQVTEHLEKHLDLISIKDQKSRAVLEQMRKDELQHASNAITAGGVELPLPIKMLMRATAKVLTLTAAKI